MPNKEIEEIEEKRFKAATDALRESSLQIQHIARTPLGIEVEYMNGWVRIFGSIAELECFVEGYVAAKKEG